MSLDDIWEECQECEGKCFITEISEYITWQCENCNQVGYEINSEWEYV